MKYLKTFESTDEKSYWEITVDQLCLGIYGDTETTDEETQFIKDNWIEFTPDEISKIISVIPPSYNPNIFTGLSNTLLIHYEYFRCEIFKLKDEWYYIEVTISPQYLTNYQHRYQCDQFDGLLDCIKYLCRLK